MPVSGTKLGPVAYNRWRATRLGALTEKIERKLVWDLAGDPGGLLLLDVGCGDGALTRQAVLRGARVVGLDADPAMLTAARRRPTPGRGVAWWVRGLAQQLPVCGACCDLVVAVTMLCFLGEAEAREAVGEMARVLKPGGRLILGELSPWSPWAAGRRVRGWMGSPLWRGARFHAPEDLRGFTATAGLETRTLRGAVYYPPWWWAARLLAPWDHLLSRLTNLGAAFLVLAADKPAVR